MEKRNRKCKFSPFLRNFASDRAVINRLRVNYIGSSHITVTAGPDAGAMAFGCYVLYRVTGRCTGMKLKTHETKVS